MNKFRQHIPNWADVDRPKDILFSDLNDLIKQSKIIQAWIEDPAFYQLSLNDNYLMAESNKGKNWWVLGTISSPEKLNLPKWNPVY